ncbi:PTS system trehalose-specific EIIBC component [Oceanobacillus kimchii]|uniref:PTS system trehalose-specific EIIBC component n=1 Tax=Oceanobacillus kimchii TaxID=746691 RepID=UPI0021A6E59A|nr:PTS system trehalose-specific EIIBC component [Oceanobacillus kimchii]
MEEAIRQVVLAPMNGKQISIDKVPDPTFSQKMMGEGVAIEPIEGEVVAPADGKVTLTFPTKHAIGITTNNGLEILIHIGLETVNLDGQGFEVHVSKGDQVQAGDRLVSFDLPFIKENAANIITPIIITNSNRVHEWSFSEDQEVEKGKSTLFEVKMKTINNGSSSKKAQNQKDDYAEEAKAIVEAVGGLDNIYAATHCVTRLRFALKDDEEVDQKKLDEMDIVQGTFVTGGQYQVIIGQGTVDKIYKSMVNNVGIKESSKEEVKAAGGKKQNALQRGVKTLADIFIPILPAIVTAGLLMGINNLLANEGVFFDASVVQVYPSWAGIADMINIIANTAFTFLPALIGWSAVKRFGGNPLLGIVLGLILVHPDLLNAHSYSNAVSNGDTIPTWNLFGLEIEKIGYQGQVLPVLVAAWVLAKIEIWLRRKVIDSLQLLVVAPVALLITGFLAFTLIGPVTFTIGGWITDGIVTIFEAAPIIGGMIYGAIYAPLVITGMHHTFLAVDLQLIGSTGTTFLWPILALSNIAQGAAVFAMMFALKDEKLKGLAGTSGISAWLGITEPAMFGVNLRFKYPFIAAVLGTSIAGAFITLQNVLATGIGIGGMPAFLSIVNHTWGAFFIGIAIVVIIPFLLTYFIAIRKQRTSNK